MFKPIVLIIAAFIALAPVPLAAQEPTPVVDTESTPELADTSITVEDGGVVNIDSAPAEPELEPPRPIVDTDSILTLVIAVSGSILLGGGGLMVLNRFLKRKDVRDVVEARYIAAPPETKEHIQGAIKLLDKAADVMNNALDFARSVTDGKPNEPPTPGAGGAG